MEFIFIPSAVESGKFEGSVTLKYPSYVEKMDFLDSMDLNIDENGLDPVDVRKKSVKAMRAIGLKAEKFIVKVDLLRKSDGFKFDSFDHLNYDSDGHSIINEVGIRLISNMNLGKT